MQHTTRDWDWHWDWVRNWSGGIGSLAGAALARLLGVGRDVDSLENIFIWAISAAASLFWLPKRGYFQMCYGLFTRRCAIRISISALALGVTI